MQINNPLTKLNQLQTKDHDLLTGLSDDDHPRYKITKGTIGSRPSAGIAGRAYYATDEGLLYQDNGTIWEKIGSVPTGSLSQGDILFYDGSKMSILSPGTSGDILQTQGAGANPAWGVPPVKVVQGTYGNEPPASAMGENGIFLDPTQDTVKRVVSGVWEEEYNAEWKGYNNLTQSMFESGSASGTTSSGSPSESIDGDTGTEADYGENDYLEVSLTNPVKADQFRQWGFSGMNEDGEWELFYKDIDGDWISITTFSSRSAESWSSYQSFPEKITKGFKIVNNIPDSTYFCTILPEFDIDHS